MYLGSFKSRLFFAMDETWITLDDCSVEKDYYYTDGAMEIPQDWKKKSEKQWPKKNHDCHRNLLVWNVARLRRWRFCRGDSCVFIDQILSKMVQNDLPRLYGNRAKDVVCHMDSAPAHTAKATVTWLEESKVKYILQAHWIANAPD